MPGNLETQPLAGWSCILLFILRSL